MKTSKGAIFPVLFWQFFKIGCCTFGGSLSIVAQIQKEYVEKRGWLTDKDLLKITSVGMIVSMFLSLCQVNYVTASGTFSPIAVFIGVLCLIALLKFKLSISLTIPLSSLLGLLLIR